MNISLEYIELLTAERLRQLPLGEDIYSIDVIEELEEDDEISSAEGGFMRGYLDSE